MVSIALAASLPMVMTTIMNVVICILIVFAVVVVIGAMKNMGEL